LLRTFLFSLAIAALITQSTYAQSLFNWAIQGAGGYSSDFGYGVAADDQGNSYITGSFYSTLNLGSTNISSPNGGYTETFVAKVSPAGVVVWARVMNCQYHDSGKGITVDSSGNVFVTGSFTGSASPGTTNLNSTGGSEDMFLSKYDSDGNFLWMVQTAGYSSEAGNAVTVDASGNAFVAGYFNGTVDFGGTNTLNSYNGTTDGFLAKYSPGGALLWVRQMGGTGSDLARGVTVDRAGNAIVTGDFADTAMFGAVCLITKGSRDIFVAKYSPTGSVLWVQQAGGPSDDYGNAVAVDSSGNCFITGNFSSSLNLGGTNLSTFGGYDVVTAKFDKDGSLVWVRQAGTGNHDYGNAISVDTNGNAFVTGSYYGTMNLGSTNLPGFAYDDIFVAKYSPDGSVLWALSSGTGNGYDSGYGVAANKLGSFFIVGQFSGSGTFGTTNLSSYAGSDVFLTKFTRDIPVIISSPISQTVMEGASVSFTVVAAGTGPFTYQWQFNGQTISNATSSTLLISSAQTNRSGAYSVVVGNYEGSVGTISAPLSVLTLADAVDNSNLIWTSGGSSPWVNQTTTTHSGPSAAKSGAITDAQQSWLQTTVVGPARVSFWWKVSSENSYDILSLQIGGVEQANISGKIEWKQVSFLVPSGPQPLRWVYGKDVSDSVGQDAGWVDEISVVYAPSIAVQPSSQTLVAGSPLGLGATISGTPPFAFQWQRDGQDIITATNQVLSVPNIQAAEAGAYTLRVSNSAATVTSAVATITVLIPPKIIQEPASYSISPGQNLELTVNATGPGLLGYQWRLNGTNIPGALGSSLVLTNLGSANAGNYTVVVSSQTGSTTSSPAKVTLTSLVMLPTVVLEGSVGNQYQIQFKNSVADTNWTVLTNIALPTNPYLHVDYTAQGKPNRFYRVVGQ
ncbi:MAG: hypothetical protein JWM16_5879, partial [Verrucomicrobiales bacterium]|nr:hypothetical protein [Verrucomicrobiales bacterium]